MVPCIVGSNPTTPAIDQKKRILPNGIAVDQAASLPSPRRGGSQTGSHGRRTRSSNPGRRWGLHLVRRNSIFHFRRRWPEKLRRRGAPEFLSVSLRTHVFSSAVKRSADLLSALEAGERNVPTELPDTTANADRVRATLQEIVRRAVADMIARQERKAPPVTSDADLRRIDAQTDRIRDAQRARDWSVASAFAREIAREHGLNPEAVEAPAVGRQVLSLLRRLNDLCVRIERDFDDPLDAGRDILRDHDISPTREALKPPMPLSGRDRESLSGGAARCGKQDPGRRETCACLLR
ncbi:DUF6538 domain-containing protein [Oceaniglobus indicus]|uniref:DUF6538 domain-containing protein n=1 Tax=Oceaniglobus indicus TaxID=2047749 RepID=UPI003B987330